VAGSSDGPKPSQPDGSNPTNKGKQSAAPVRPKKQNPSSSSRGEYRTGGPARGEMLEAPGLCVWVSFFRQEKLYASKFGISRSQFRLVKKFDLLGMKDGGFELWVHIG
jgi:hypothetical protein